VFSLGFLVGTPTAKVYVPLAQDEKIPVVGLFTGRQLPYEPLKHYVINIRASYYGAGPSVSGEPDRHGCDGLHAINDGEGVFGRVS
jgi:hypothetical protein